MITISSLFLISTILACCHGGEIIDYRLLLNPTADKVKECTEPGLFCESCTSLVRCLRSGDDEWQKVDVAKCDKKTPCTRDKCTADIPNPFCNGEADLKFKCNAAGIFPDPFYCNKYVLCTQLLSGHYEAHLTECSPFTQYDYRTGLCNIELPNDQCRYGEYPVPLCETPGQTGALPGRESVYYVCEQYDKLSHKNVYYPFLYVCDGTTIYQESYGGCV